MTVPDPSAAYPFLCEAHGVLVHEGRCPDCVPDPSAASGHAYLSDEELDELRRIVDLYQKNRVEPWRSLLMTAGLRKLPALLREVEDTRG